MYLWVIIPMSLDLVRALAGPLPRELCSFGVFMKNVISINIVLILVTLTFTKFVIIFAFKSIPVMDDKFWATFCYASTSLISIVASGCRFYQPGRPILNEVIFENIKSKMI